MINQPRNAVVSVNGGVQAFLEWSADLAARKNAAYQQAQRFVDSEVLRVSDPLTPKRNGILIGSGIRGTRIGSGVVRYAAPHARYQYYGKVMIGRAPKVLTNRPLTYQGAPERGAKWFERMKIAHRESILEGAMKIVSN